MDIIGLKDLIKEEHNDGMLKSVDAPDLTLWR